MKIKQSEFILFISFIMKSLFYGPGIYSILHTSYQNSLISIIISMFLGIIPLTIFIKLFNKKIVINNNILEIFEIMHCSLILWNLTNFIKSQFLVYTPNFVIILLMIIVIFIINKDLKILSKSAIIFFIINVILFIIPGISLANKTDLSQLKPFLDKEFLPIIKGSFIMINLNVIPIFFLLKYSNENIEKLNYKNSLYIYLYIFFEMFSIILICITTLGINLANIYNYPEFHILKTINISTFLQRIESVLSIEWIFDSIISICIIIKSKNKYKNNLKIILTLLLTLIIFKNNTNPFNFYMNVYPFIILIILIYIIIKHLFIKVIKSKDNEI